MRGRQSLRARRPSIPDTTLMMRPAQNAEPKPFTSSASLTSPTHISIHAFTTMLKTPSVNINAGNATKRMMLPTIAFAKPKSAATHR